MGTRRERVKVLLIGADGFIGRHIAYDLKSRGVTVLAHGRRTSRLDQMGFTTLEADLADPKTHDPQFWAPHLADGTSLVDAAGLLTGSEAAFAAVHEHAPQAMMTALERLPPERRGRAVLISAVGLDAGTPFARWRRRTEEIFAGQTILRPGLVLGETSYGGSSLLRALAAMPVLTPVVGNGEQRFNPIHARDLADAVFRCLETPPGPGPWEIGGPEEITQVGLIGLVRRWLGLSTRPMLRLPVAVARAIGNVGDLLQLGPISATSVSQLEHGVLANPQPLLERIASRPKGVSLFMAERPAGTQDLWQARLYLLKPAVRLTLALMWLVSAALGLFLPLSSFAASVPALPEASATLLARLGGLADGALGLLLLANRWPREVADAQLALVAGYTLGLTAIAPALWLDPFGGLLKNLPVLALILVHRSLVEER